MKVLLTEKGLDYAASVAVDAMKMEDMSIEDFTGKDSISVGSVEYTVKQIRVSQV